MTAVDAVGDTSLRPAAAGRVDRAVREAQQPAWQSEQRRKAEARAPRAVALAPELGGRRLSNSWAPARRRLG
jgi:hypothetical protein